VRAELTWFDRNWYRVGALDFVTTVAYMLIALVTVTSVEELLLIVSAAASSRRQISLQTVVLSVHAHLRNRTSELLQVVHARRLWPWLGSPLAALRYVMYFRFYV